MAKWEEAYRPGGLIYLDGQRETLVTGRVRERNTGAWDVEEAGGVESTYPAGRVVCVLWGTEREVVERLAGPFDQGKGLWRAYLDQEGERLLPTRDEPPPDRV